MNYGMFLKTCRHSLGYTVREMQLELCLKDELTIRRMEDGKIDVQGPTWVAILSMLDREGITDLAKQLQGIVDAIRARADDKNVEKENRFQAKKAESDLTKARQLLAEDQEYGTTL